VNEDLYVFGEARDRDYARSRCNCIYPFGVRPRSASRKSGADNVRREPFYRDALRKTIESQLSWLIS